MWEEAKQKTFRGPQKTLLSPLKRPLEIGKTLQRELKSSVPFYQPDPMQLIENHSPLFVTPVVTSVFS